MARIRYVVVSDLHLGAAYSLLTHATDDGKAQPRDVSPVLRQLERSLRATLAACADNAGVKQGGSPQLPTLVLLGDVFDLAFSPPVDTMAAFETLIRTVFDPDEPAMFSPTILYVPGNHDHRHWQIIRDEMDLAALIAASAGDDMPQPVLVTDLMADVLPVGQVVTALARRATGDPRLEVRSGYPNVGFHSGDRWVVMHHGHYTESAYRAISSVLAMLAGGRPATDAGDIELINGPWIDFLWSSFGGQGPVGGDVFDLWETMQDAAASHAAVQSLATRLISSISKKAPVRGDSTITTHGVSVSIRGLVEALLDMSLARFAQSERMDADSVLTPSGVEGVSWYLDNTVRPQLMQSGWQSDRDSLSFVFGHTHKPFQDQILVPSFVEPIQLWNTGGWVLDQPSLSPAQGAAVVVVDSDANVASIRLFNDPIDGDVGTVNVSGCAGVDPSDNPLIARLRAAVEATTEWADFSSVVLPEIDKRAKFIRAMFFNPSGDPQGAHTATATAS